MKGFISRFLIYSINLYIYLYANTMVFIYGKF